MSVTKLSKINFVLCRYHCCTRRLDKTVMQIINSTYIQSRLATGCTVRGSNPGGGKFSAPLQTGPGPLTASCTMGTGSFPGAKGQGVALTIHPHPAPRLKKEYSYTSNPPLGPRGLLYSGLTRLLTHRRLNFLLLTK